MCFNSELEFEDALINVLVQCGWSEKVLKNYDEKQLLNNWAKILFDNNRGIDQLNGCPLTEGEMSQILEQIELLKTPLKLNGFINGKSVSIKRDNTEDKLHFGKEVSLKIYDRHEIAAGQSVYQIVRQPRFSTKSPILNSRRGDLMLLINGMPVIHIELKKSGVSVNQACHQIKKYSHEGVFSGIFSLIQIFVAMEPNETVYFANPGPNGRFNSNYYFHWANVDNEPINQWRDVVAKLLSIPMAHQLIGLYTIADESDGLLKVMRSYQYYAASKICDRAATNKWEDGEQLGGFVYHTTGSGKTMTSFKSAQLISNAKYADKVVFLIDRIDLGTQSLKEYRNFAEENESVQETENTGVLVTKLKSNASDDTMIVTSIQKMSRIKEEGALKLNDIKIINSKRIVFIVDEAHRSTFGEMLITIKKTFPKALFFGFTGTPIFYENKKKKCAQSDVFGDELHRYIIADGIRDGNVLGFDPYKVLTYKDKDLRQVIALEKAHAETVIEAISNPEKKKIFYKYMYDVPMAGYFNHDGTYIKGIEDYIPLAQYRSKEHIECVVHDIIENWMMLSQNGKFHAIFATSSIQEAIHYYRIFKNKSSLKVTAVFDSNIDNNESAIQKEDGLVEIVEDYNKQYQQMFTIPTFSKMKKDISARLSHKKPYENIENHPDKQIDLLIVVNQMLTGFDSKWINTLYLDKILVYEEIIQAFSRTNRLFGPEKPFGTIKYYRKPHTMNRNIEEAIKLYSGEKPISIFVPRLKENILKMNCLYHEIKSLFELEGIENFEKLPESVGARAKFAKDFKQLNDCLEASKIQGFRWDKKTYYDQRNEEEYEIAFAQITYYILVQRYKELFNSGGSGKREENVPYDIDGYITEIDTGKIDEEYMNEKFKKYLKLLDDKNSDCEKLKKIEDELHRVFAVLTQEEQKYADIFLHDIQRGDVQVKENKTLYEYINDYIYEAKNDRVHKLAKLLGLDEDKLRDLMKLRLTEANINEFGRFEDLKKTVNKEKAKAYLEWRDKGVIILPIVMMEVDALLRKFILSGGMDFRMPKDL